ncbi:WbqC family protein [Fluviicola taffensis]|uniref:WbqC-like family protein n=1 Tax=Fluviicola taffensis (strain DSM 16823 / NCIMB 13979 / RW262) TaxID=755732 RepID=F2IDY2_FLUTR|nr:WbqC family protein [Fluviicola taffensis]AEA45546.1 WbqC-like family protein [Fluviicola taffensis DSM 16823]
MSFPVFPIAYFGSVRYFQDLAQEKQVCLEISDHLPKQTFRNRMIILGSQGPQVLTMPLEKPAGSKTLTKDVVISYQQNWPTIHWRSLKTSYAAAPFFEHYASDIEQLLFKKFKFLVDLNLEINAFIQDAFQFSVESTLTETYETSYSTDYRESNYETLAMIGTYNQVLFTQKQFVPEVSILDLLFCEGPIGRKLIL